MYVNHTNKMLASINSLVEGVCRVCSKKKLNNCTHGIKLYLKEYSESTGIHGIRYLSEKRSFAENFRLIWIIIMSLSLCGCVFMIFKIWTKYENSPIVVSFATKDTPIYEIPFPAVTICPESKCSRQQFNYSDIYQRIRSNESVTNAEFQKFSYMNLLCDHILEVNHSTKTSSETIGNDFFTVINELKPDFGSVMCYFMSKFYKCEELLIPLITDVGICYSFNIIDRNEIFEDNVIKESYFYKVGVNSKDFNGDEGYTRTAAIDTYPRRALMSGIDNALTIYFENKDLDNDYVCNRFHEGFRILVHNPMDVPIMSRHYFRVSLDKAVVAAVQPELVLTSEKVKEFEPKTRNCYLGSERPLRYFKMYTRSNCLLECLTNSTLSKCGCVRFFMPRENGTPICGDGITSCLKSAEIDMKVKELESKISGSLKTHCDCEPLCTDLKYNMETSQSDFFWHEYFMFQDKSGNFFEDLTNDERTFSVLSIYFKSDEFMTLERKELYGVSDFISNFGGLLGLFTGFSLISFAEIAYFMSVRILCNIKLYGKWSGSSD